MKKQSAGVITFGILAVIIGIIAFMEAYPEINTMYNQYSKITFQQYVIRVILLSVCTTALLISGIGVIFLKNWARISFMIFSIIIAVTTFLILFFWFPIISIVFFTRPKVKEQFKGIGSSLNTGPP